MFYKSKWIFCTFSINNFKNCVPISAITIIITQNKPTAITETGLNRSCWILYSGLRNHQNMSDNINNGELHAKLYDILKSRNDETCILVQLHFLGDLIKGLIPRHFGNLNSTYRSNLRLLHYSYRLSSPGAGVDEPEYMRNYSRVLWHPRLTCIYSGTRRRRA